MNGMNAMSKTGTIFDLLEKHSSFRYEEAKQAGYTDEEIFAHLSDSSSRDSLESVEISFGRKIEVFVQDYPVFSWSFLGIITICIALLLTRCAWKLIKLMLYQIVYTIFKAINDVKISRD